MTREGSRRLEVKAVLTHPNHNGTSLAIGSLEGSVPAARLHMENFPGLLPNVRSDLFCLHPAPLEIRIRRYPTAWLVCDDHRPHSAGAKIPPQFSRRGCDADRSYARHRYRERVSFCPAYRLFVRLNRLNQNLLEVGLRNPIQDDAGISGCDRTR